MRIFSRSNPESNRMCHSDVICRGGTALIFPVDMASDYVVLRLLMDEWTKKERRE